MGICKRLLDNIVYEKMFGYSLFRGNLCSISSCSSSQLEKSMGQTLTILPPFQVEEMS